MACRRRSAATRATTPDDCSHTGRSSRPGSFAHSSPASCRRRPGDGVADRGDDAREPDDENERTRHEEGAANARSPAPRRASRRGDATRRAPTTTAPASSEDGEGPTVDDAVGAERAVLDERGPRERPASHREARQRGHERAKAVGKARLRKIEPEREDRDGADEAGPRLREQQRDGRRVDEEQTPDAELDPRARARARGPGASAASASSASAFQYPTGSRSRATRSPSSKSAGTATPSSAHASAAATTAATTRGEPARAGGARTGQDPESQERQVDEPAGEPVPGAVARRSTRRSRCRPRRSTRPRRRRPRARPGRAAGAAGGHARLPPARRRRRGEPRPPTVASASSRDP